MHPIFNIQYIQYSISYIQYPISPIYSIQYSHNQYSCNPELKNSLIYSSMKGFRKSLSRPFHIRIPLLVEHTPLLISPGQALVTSIYQRSFLKKDSYLLHQRVTAPIKTKDSIEEEHHSMQVLALLT